MANTNDLLGALLKRGMTNSSKGRIEHSLGESGGLGDLLQKHLGIPSASLTASATPSGATPSGRASESGGPFDALGKLGDLAKSFLGDSDHKQSMAAGGLGALLGAIVGGGGKSAKGALGGGALALLGSIALKALQNATNQSSEPAELDQATRLAAGFRTPENAEEERQVQEISELTVQAMVNAAKADGRIDEDEMQSVVGELQEDGISQAEREYLLNAVRKPSDIDELVRKVPNRQVAAQIYAASLLAIEVDTPAEKAYMRELAQKLGLDSRVVDQLHATLGMV